MFTFSKATSKTQLPSPRFRTFNGWTSTIARMRALGSSSAKARKPMLWLRRGNNNLPAQSVERPKAIPKHSISPPSSSNYSSFPLVVAPVSQSVETTVPLYAVDSQAYPAFGPSHCTKVVLVASADASRPCRIRRIDTRKELPWTPSIWKPLPPLPSSNASCLSTTSSASSYQIPPANSLEDTFDDGLDDLSLFLRRVAYDVISASTIHRHLGFMEDGGRVLPLGRRMLSGRISPPRRYSSLMGVSLAIMEGRLPKALMAM